ncbi:Uu.00g106130.m01.CDS01 [Anthostomella pinea]|uniref:Uu.00g106130.m01.CDS01 n=1 Tax=Anthostomella pinea TaxID=933095 RepID=A0AAI8VES3_9PEZI|nr:Uu.00g106130.m01.CDS01 [Anthostomella pinea]
MADPHDDATGAPAATSHETSPMTCCCGSPECVFLRHNCSVLDSVEKDVHQAARMGQPAYCAVPRPSAIQQQLRNITLTPSALLARHEAYMADAERDRNELTARIEHLEVDNKELEARNARSIEENRALLDQLEAMNTSVNDSEGRIKSLEATLLSSQQTIRRLERETLRAEALERQLIALEQEQADLQNTLIMSREEARSAMWRWKQAERGINDLQEQLERMENEAREEREHHVEMMSRIEKQREMEKELNTAAGRLKGAAAAKSLKQGNGGSSVVGHFVRDLLQDNANLQHSMAELREMLMNSNDEIQALREQLAYHQPVEDGESSATPTLRAELETKESPSDDRETSPKFSQELHIHHHYHVSTPKQEAKKPRKKRSGLTAGIFIPPATSLPSTPPNRLMRQQQAPHSRTDSLPSNRWSVYSEQPSEFATSSVPSSPQSNNRHSVFDPIPDSSPGSPTTSVDPMSPTWRATHRKQPSNMSSPSVQLPASFSLNPATPRHSHAIIEESDDGEGLPELAETTDESTGDDEASSRGLGTLHDDISITLTDTDSDGTPPVRLRRAMSHESIMSLSGGLDIHTLKSRPSQLTIGHLGSATSVTGSSAVTARPMMSCDSAKRSSAILHDSYGSSPIDSLRSVSNPAAQNESSKLGKWVGWRPWGGGGGTAGGGGTPSKAIREKETQRHMSRPPGINQAGAIPGFSEYLAAAQKKGPPVKTSPDAVDRDALREGLGE